MPAQPQRAQIIGRMSAVQRFLQKLIVQHPERRRSPGVAGYLCKMGVGTQDPKDPTWVVYKPEDFSRAEIFLREAGLPTEPSRKSTSKSKGAAEVEAASPATNEFVAMAALNSPSLLPKGALYAVMRAHDAANIPHDVVLICQHLRTLKRIHQFNWLDRYLKGRRALALFKGGRGASGFSVSGAKLTVHLSNAPALALVDLDMAGLVVAARIPRLEALCVPSWPQFEQQQDVLVRQAPTFNHQLDSASHPDIVRAWKLLRANPRGLSADCFPVDPLRD
jgi:hypothetical protein